jgi:hypothetical protein
MSRLLCLLIALLLSCSSDPEPARGGGGGTGGMAGAGGGSASGGPGTGGSAPGGAATADAQPGGGAGGLGGAGRGGAPGPSFRDAARTSPDAPVDAAADAADGGRVQDAAAPDLRIRSDAQVPDGGFRYPDPQGRLCGSARHTLSKTPAELLVVLDRSGSMATPTTPGRTRWFDARDAVIGAVSNAGNLAWGLKLFPSIGANTGSVCAVGTGVDVGVGFGHAGAVGNALMHAGPPTASLGSGTPTEPAILGGTAYLKTVTTPLQKYMVLVTDGLPTCAILPDPALPSAAAGLEATVKALDYAAAAGVRTFVIGISSAMSLANLNRLADAGGMPRAVEPRYYPAESQSDLDAALQAISRAVTTCVFPLVTRPLAPDFVGVSVGSMRVPRDLDRIDGWDYVNNGTAIEIYGPTCDALKTGVAENADIHFGCPN